MFQQMDEVEFRQYFRLSLACSKCSDSGERCEVEKAFIFSRSFLLRTAPHYLDAWNGLGSLVKQIIFPPLQRVSLGYEGLGYN